SPASSRPGRGWPDSCAGTTESTVIARFASSRPSSVTILIYSYATQGLYSPSYSGMLWLLGKREAAPSNNKTAQLRGFIVICIPSRRFLEHQENGLATQTLNRKFSTSPSLTTYSLPSARILPASLAPCSPLKAMKSS